MNDTDLMYLLVTGFFALGVAGGLGGFFGFRKLYRIGKARIIWVNGDGRVVDESYLRPIRGKIYTKERDYLLDGEAKHGGKYSTWLLDPLSGWNFRAPTRKETFDTDRRLAVLEPSNPESYHRAMHRHRWNDLLRAGDDSDKYKWVPLVAILGFVVLLCVLGGIGWVITHMPTSAPPPPGV